MNHLLCRRRRCGEFCGDRIIPLSFHEICNVGWASGVSKQALDPDSVFSSGDVRFDELRVPFTLPRFSAAPDAVRSDPIGVAFNDGISSLGPIYSRPIEGTHRLGLNRVCELVDEYTSIQSICFGIFNDYDDASILFTAEVCHCRFTGIHFLDVCLFPYRKSGLPPDVLQEIFVRV